MQNKLELQKGFRSCGVLELISLISLKPCDPG